MPKLIYATLAVQLITFTLCVVVFVLTTDIFQYLLALFNLALLFNTARMSSELGL